MYKITLKGLAGNAVRTNNDGEGYEELTGSDLSIVDGIDCQEEFSEYFDDDDEQPLIAKGVENGYMRFVVEDDKLYVVVEYDSHEELTEEEIEILIEYTQGQLSDGIGEGFEQNPCTCDEDDNEILVSPWYYGQHLNATQYDEDMNTPKQLIPSDPNSEIQ
jgi:hypothetical protein